MAHLSEYQLKQIKNRLQLELTKRSFHTPITSFIEVGKGDKARVEFETAPFNTTPAIFKSCKVCNFSSRIITELNPAQTITYNRVWINIQVSYETYDGGRNGVGQFHFEAFCEIDGHNIYDFKIS